MTRKRAGKSREQKAYNALISVKEKIHDCFELLSGVERGYFRGIMYMDELSGIRRHLAAAERELRSLEGYFDDGK